MDLNHITQYYRNTAYKSITSYNLIYDKYKSFTYVGALWLLFKRDFDCKTFTCKNVFLLWYNVGY